MAATYGQQTIHRHPQALDPNIDLYYALHFITFRPLVEPFLRLALPAEVDLVTVVVQPSEPVH